MTGLLPAASRLRLCARLFRRDRCGVAALEFALILPVILLLYLGGAEVTQTIIASRKATLVARALSDLVAQLPSGSELTDADLANVFAAGGAIMSPFSTSTLRMTITSVEFVARADAPYGYDAKPRWSVVRNGGSFRPCAVLTPVANAQSPSPTSLPVGLYQPGSIIVADVTYVYQAPFLGGAFRSSGGAGMWEATSNFLTSRQTSYMRPRAQNLIIYAPAVAPQGSQVCPTY